MHTDLIYDVGAHIGDDTAFYLAKGFRVVAVEAHPEFCAQLRHRFAADLHAQRLDVLNVALSAQPGVVTLLESQIDSQWSTILPTIARTRPGEHHPMAVAALPFDVLLAHFGVPYYLKVDIEGCEDVLLASLRHCESLPQYVSYEVNAEWSTNAALLRQLGFSRFKLVNQALLHDAVLPQPAREGLTVDWTFRGYTSGPFGEETAGPWIPASEFPALAHEHMTTKTTSADWYDIHAAL